MNTIYREVNPNEKTWVRKEKMSYIRDKYDKAAIPDSLGYGLYEIKIVRPRESQLRLSHSYEGGNILIEYSPNSFTVSGDSRHWKAVPESVKVLSIKEADSKHGTLYMVEVQADCPWTKITLTRTIPMYGDRLVGKLKEKVLNWLNNNDFSSKK